MKRAGIVFGMEFRETLRSKSFIIISSLMASVLLSAAILLFAVPVLLGGGQPENADIPDMFIDIMPDGSGKSALYTVAVDDRTGSGLLDRLRERLPQLDLQECELDDALIESALESGVDCCVILNDALDFACYEKSSFYGTDVPSLISGKLEDIAREDAMTAAGVPAEEAGDILDMRAWYSMSFIGGFGMSKYLINTIISMLLFTMITLYGQMVAVRVTTEKSTRTVEVLSTAVSPSELLFGKVAGVGAAALMQLAAFLLLLFAILRTAASRSSLLAVIAQQLQLPASDIVLLCAYFLLGFAFVAFLYGGLGALVSQTEDLSGGVASLPMTVMMMGYFIAIFSATIGTTNPLLVAASFVPFWSPVVMFSRMSLETVSWWELALSLALLAAATVFAARLSAKLYRRGMLRYGKAPRLKELFAELKK